MSDGAGRADASTIATRDGGVSRGLKDRTVKMLKKIVRGPLVAVRSFLTRPVTVRLDEFARTQQGLADFANRIKVFEQRLLVLEQNVGFLHKKADEAAVKSRPLVHLKDAYAVALADGYIFLPEDEEALLLMYAAAGSEGLEPGTRRVLHAVLEPGGTAVDVGASVGLHMTALARAVGPAGTVHAFEAEPRLAPMLRRTIAVNGFSCVRLHPVAVGDRDGQARFNVANVIGHSSLYDLPDDEGVRQQIEIPMRALDSVLPPGTRVDLIKIDVEGAELDVLHGAERVLRDSPGCAIVAEWGPSHLRRTGQTGEHWFAEFARLGFEPYAISEPDGRLRRISPAWAAKQFSVNILFLQKGSAVQARLQERRDLMQQ